MEYEEALNWLDKYSIGILEIKRIISKALEKQIPKKPRIIKRKIHSELHIYQDCAVCPCCFERFCDNQTELLKSIIHKTDKYCSRCGQAIDWGE